MIMKKILSLLMIAILLFSACQQTNSAENELIEVEATVEEMDPIIMESRQISSAHLKLVPALFKAKLDNTPNIRLLDVRTPEELAENGTIKGAQNLDFYNADFNSKLEAMDKEIPVMLYCRSGGRSGEAAAMMKEMGFKQVYDLNGGYDAWLAEFPNK
jgi:phage shock protein E